MEYNLISEQEHNDKSEDIVEYRADHLELDELERITTETNFYSTVVKKLISRGSKVIVGPRGVGKTHHMRIAYKKCLSSKSKPFPVYVSFSKYLRLEPLRNTSTIAIQFFHCWVLSKILLAVKKTLEDLDSITENSEFPCEELTWESIQLFCDQIEKQQQLPWHESVLNFVSINLVSEYIENVISACGRKQCILLCDDAALVLAQDYMIEFFDIFRGLNSIKISPKASVYPNTEFGPRFHLGHDAEAVPCWPPILDDSYEELFKGIYTKRFTSEIKEDVLKCLMYASFGVPRAFINLINQYNLDESTSTQKKVNTIIEDQSNLVSEEYLTLAIKQPQFKNYVHAGKSLLDTLIKELSLENQDALKQNAKQLIIGIKQDNNLSVKVNKNISIIIRLLEETGLLQKISPVKHGKGRVYDRFIPHFTLLIAEGAFQRGKSGYVTNFSESINFKSVKHPFRKNSFAEFDTDNILDTVFLDLPNCSNCQTPRTSEDQRFCMNCGSELINKSTFNSLISNTIESLPITKWLKNKIITDTDLKTIGDIVLSSNAGQELRKAKGIGEVKATKVITQAESWMDEYLS
jgi:hypothetical protein